MAEAGIEERGRKLVWYFFRHIAGTYIYDEYQDLRMVADVLRQNIIDAANCYVHPLPEEAGVGGLDLNRPLCSLISFTKKNELQQP